MRKQILTVMKKLLAFLLLAVTSCVPSIHPLYHNKDLIIDQRLFGSWADEDEIWKFDKLPPGKSFLGSTTDSVPGYLLTITEKGAPADFIARTLKLDDQLFLDIFPKVSKGDFEIEGVNNSWLKMHYFPVHTFARLRFNEGKLLIEPFDPDFITRLLEQKKIRISHEESDNRFILTADTDELQKFVVKFGRDPKAYVEPGIFSKMEP